MRASVTAFVAAGVLTACVQRQGAGAKQEVPTPPGSSQPLIEDGYTGRYQADVTVLEDASHGPQMCFNVATSLPPQCGGIDLVGWSWDDVEHEAAQGTRWGSYRVTGRFEGDEFEVTEVDDAQPVATNPTPKKRGDHTPCEEPAGGWVPVDAAKATDAAMQAASDLAQRSPDFAGLWIDQGPVESEATANDPRRFILNVAFTGEVDEHTTRLREVWGGALCVSKARYSQAQLNEIQAQLMKSSQFVSSGIDVYTNSVTVELAVATEEQQKEMDAKYGVGAFVLSGRLRPID
jgi:hypothetical protein